MKLLSQLLARLRKEKHRVLIYSQMTAMLDILEVSSCWKIISLLQDFMNAGGFKYVRLDGSYKLDDRQEMVDMFQNEYVSHCVTINLVAKISSPSCYQLELVVLGSILLQLTLSFFMIVIGTRPSTAKQWTELTDSVKLGQLPSTG